MASFVQGTLGLTSASRGAPPPLRPYQIEAVAGVRRELTENRGTLVLMATGLGKTQVAAELIRGTLGRCLFLAHRDELITQAGRRIEQFTGTQVEVEQANRLASPFVGSGAAIPVVASVQTLSRPKRLERFDPDAFSLVVVDEVHHGVAPTYRRILDHFGAAKVVGLTATPDRLDGAALGAILDSVAYRYELTDAIRDGWLAPITIRSVTVDVDFAGVRTVAGDFNQGELDKLMAEEKNLHAVAKPAVECAGERKTIVFTTSVHNAHRLAEIINRYTMPGKAAVVDGTMDRETDRRRVLDAFSRGEHQFLVNVGIATEGYDEPSVACVVMGRPTKSRALYVQMLGRATRGGPNCPIPGKTDALVLDFVGNAGQHDIVCALDALAGDADAEVLADAKTLLGESDNAVLFGDALDAAKAKQAARREAERLQDELGAERRKHVKAQVTYKLIEPNPYVSLGVKRDFLAERYGHKPASQAMLDALARWMGKRHKDLPANLSQTEARRLMAVFKDRADKGLATYSQLRTLGDRAIDARQMPRTKATKILDAIAGNGWRPIAQDQLNKLIGGE